MAGFHHRVYARLPEFLKKRINPLEYDIEAFVREAAATVAPGATVLDAGAGESRFARLFQKGFYVALDLAVGEAAWDYSKIHVCARLDAIPLASDRIDAAIHIQVLEHVPDPAAVLRELHRVLKPGGKLYLTAPQGWSEHQQPHDYFRFTSYALRSLFTEAGFEVRRIEPQGGYFHYLGHRLSYIPKILFQERQGVARVLLFPLELASLALFCFCSPLLCHALDGLDKRREFTLGYRCVAVKPPVPSVLGS